MQGNFSSDAYNPVLPNEGFTPDSSRKVLLFKLNHAKGGMHEQGRNLRKAV